MRQKTRIRGLCFVAAVLLFLMLMLFSVGKVKDAVMVFSKDGPSFTVILDPGHGGLDGGAVGINGVVEKDVNLSIALELRALLEAAGYSVVMTREEDVSIHDQTAKTVAEKKRSDLKNRLKLTEDYPDSIFISIHQNRFSESKYSGAQMFYGKNHPESKVLAEILQQSIVSLLQEGNTRQVKPAGKELYLLYHSDRPTVLAECGFLSNPQEEALLNTEEYRRKMAFAIFSAVLKYCGQLPEEGLT